MNDWKKDADKEEGEGRAQSSSIISDTRNAIKSVSRIYTIEKNIFIILGIVTIIFVILVLDILTLKSLSFIPYNITDTMIIVSSTISIGALLFLLRLLLKSRQTLDDLADMFERNSIKAGISMSMANKSKEEAVRAIAETMDQIGEPLRKYILSKENFNEFLDVVVDNDLILDVLIDADHVKLETKTTSDRSNSNDLKKILKEYGSIIVKIVGGIVDKYTIQSFSILLSKYTALTNNKVGLVLIIGEGVTDEAYNTVGQIKNAKRNHIVLIEKPEKHTSLNYKDI